MARLALQRNAVFKVKYCRAASCLQPRQPQLSHGRSLPGLLTWRAWRALRERAAPPGSARIALPADARSESSRHGILQVLATAKSRATHLSWAVQSFQLPALSTLGNAKVCRLAQLALVGIVGSPAVPSLRSLAIEPHWNENMKSSCSGGTSSLDICSRRSLAQ